MEKEFKTGFMELDRVLNGVLPGQVLLIASKGGEGKSAFMTKAFLNGVIDGAFGVFFSFELSERELATRITSINSGVLFGDIFNNRLTKQDNAKVSNTFQELAQHKLLIVEALNMSIVEMRTQCLYINDRNKKNGLPPINLIAVDCLSNIRPKKGVLDQKLTKALEGLRMLASEFNCAVMVTCFLNRTGDDYENEITPSLAHLDELGIASSDAHKIILISRKNDSDVADIIIAKNINGSTGKVKLGWNGPTLSFYDLSERNIYGNATDERNNHTNYL